MRQPSRARLSLPGVAASLAVGAPPARVKPRVGGTRAVRTSMPRRSAMTASVWPSTRRAAMARWRGVMPPGAGGGTAWGCMGGGQAPQAVEGGGEEGDDRLAPPFPGDTVLRGPQQPVQGHRGCDGLQQVRIPDRGMPEARTRSGRLSRRRPRRLCGLRAARVGTAPLPRSTGLPHRVADASPTAPCSSLSGQGSCFRIPDCAMRKPSCARLPLPRAVASLAMWARHVRTFMPRRRAIASST
jgi:hypothetical protein